MSKRILIVAMNQHWPGISRLPSGLKRAGFIITTLCPKKSFLAQSVQVDDSIQYPIFSYSRSKIFYILAIYSLFYFKPDFIIPGDEEAILVLHRLSVFFGLIPGLGKWQQLIRNSMTPSEFDSIIESKELFVESCRDWGIRVPKSFSVSHLQQATQLVPELGGFPVVIKKDSGYGGSGVAVCENQEELNQKFREFQEPPHFTVLIKHILRKFFFISIFDSGEGLSLQQYIDGQVALAPFVALRGELFAINPMIKVLTYPTKTSPSCVVQGFENDEVFNFSKIVASKLNYNGFGSLDVMIENSTGKCFVIELNPRPIPTVHLKAEVIGNDLCVCLFNALNNIKQEAHPLKLATIALFPNELKRDPNSPYIKDGYHDIPENEPKLMESLLKNHL